MLYCPRARAREPEFIEPWCRVQSMHTVQCIWDDRHTGDNTSYSIIDPGNKNEMDQRFGTKISAGIRANVGSDLVRSNFPIPASSASQRNICTDNHPDITITPYSVH